MPLTNVALKIAIVESGKKQNVIARSCRIPETRFSHIVRGRAEATDKEKARIAKALNRVQDDLFPLAVAS